MGTKLLAEKPDPSIDDLEQIFELKIRALQEDERQGFFMDDNDWDDDFDKDSFGEEDEPDDGWSDDDSDETPDEDFEPNDDEDISDDEDNDDLLAMFFAGGF